MVSLSASSGSLSLFAGILVQRGYNKHLWEFIDIGFGESLKSINILDLCFAYLKI